MSTLRHRLNDLASTFASSVLEAIRSASLEELLAESSSAVHRRGAGRPARALDGLHAVAAPSHAPHHPAHGGASHGGRARASGRLARRSSDDIEQVIARIVGLLKQHPKGLRAEEIRSKLGLLSKEMPRPLKEALDGGRLGKSGQKRATTYFVKGGGPAPAKAPAAKAPAKAPAKKGRGKNKK
jgi:hypothetical protein